MKEYVSEVKVCNLFSLVRENASVTSTLPHEQRPENEYIALRVRAVYKKMNESMIRVLFHLVEVKSCSVGYQTPMSAIGPGDCEGIKEILDDRFSRQIRLSLC